MLPGCECRRSLSVSGLAPRALFSASPATCGPARLNAAPAWCIATAWTGADGSGVTGSGRWRCSGCRPGSRRRRRCGSGRMRSRRGRPGPWLAAMAMEGLSLAPLVPCGLPLALGCRRLWRLGYRRGAWIAGIALGATTVMVALPAGLLGPLAIAACAVALGVPVWLAWWWLAWRG